MDGLPLFAMAVGALILGAVVFLPLFLPWPQRVRWTVVAQAMSHAGSGLAMCPPLDLREVELVSVDGRGSAITLGILEVGHPACDTLTFMGTTPPTAELVAMLRGWCALRTPMLLFIDTAGVASLDGPVAGVTDLQCVGPR
jgi:hypothetical protein